MTKKTVSEQLFEDYLRIHGLDDFTYEPELPGTTRHPDYLVPIDGEKAFFEVKEFETPAPAARVGSFDPYPPVRNKIHKAKEKFRGLTGKMCSLVVANPHNAFVFLEPTFIFGAMLGNVGMTMPFDAATGSFDGSRAKNTFLSGGKMICYVSGEPHTAQNTTISAICVVRLFSETSRRARIRMVRERHNTGRALSPEQIANVVQEVEETNAWTAQVPRIVVCENPYAAAPLSSSFGTGPYDERFGIREDRLHRVHVGSLLKALEVEEQAAGVPQRDLMRGDS